MDVTSPTLDFAWPTRNIYESKDEELNKIDWSLRMEEFFRDKELVSLRFTHYVDLGGAHPSHGFTSMNFGGQDIGLVEITELFDTAEDTLKFVQRYCEHDLRKQFGDESLADYTLDSYAMDKGWGLFEAFNFDKHGIAIHLGEFQGLPHVLGSPQVRVPWSDLQGKLSKRFCKTKMAKIFGLSKHCPSLNN